MRDLEAFVLGPWGECATCINMGVNKYDESRRRPLKYCGGWGGGGLSKHARAFTILAAFILCMIFLGAMNDWEDNVEPTNDFFQKIPTSHRNV